MKYLTPRLWVTCGWRKAEGMKWQGSPRSHQDPSSGTSFSCIAPTSPRSGLETLNVPLSAGHWELIMLTGCSGMCPALILTSCHSQSGATATHPFVSNSYTCLWLVSLCHFNRSSWSSLTFSLHLHMKIIWRKEHSWFLTVNIWLYDNTGSWLGL